MNRRTPPHPCARCGEAVLGLAGQDGFLPTYAVQECDLNVLTAHGAVGWVHAKCLLESGYAEYWTEALSTMRTQLEGTVRRFHSPLLVVLEHLTTKDRVVVHCGMEVRLPQTAIVSMKLDEDRVWLPVEHELNLDLSGQLVLCQEVELALKLTGPFPLSRLVESLALMPRMLEPRSLERGSIMPLKEEPHVTFQSFAQRALCAVARYELCLPVITSPALLGQ